MRVFAKSQPPSCPPELVDRGGGVGTIARVASVAWGVSVARVALIALIALGACTSSSPAVEQRAVLATISGVPLYLDEYEAHLKRMEFGGEDGLPSVAGEHAQRQALLDDLVERHLLLREAEHHNVVVGMDEVEAHFQRAASGWLQDSPGSECESCVFEDALRAKGMTLADIRQAIREDLMIRKYYRDHVFSRVAVTDHEIDEFIAAHPERRVRPEEVRAQQIVVKTEEHAEQILQEIRRGLSFEEAAMKYSMSPSAKTGGDLGYFARGSMPEVFEEACFALRPGSVSKVVASDYGFHLFKVIDKRPEREVEMAVLRDEVERELRRVKEHAAQTAKLAELRAGATIVVKEDVLAQIE